MARVVHFDLPADDPDRAVKFYEQVLGWHANRLGPQMGNYILLETGEGEGIDGGMGDRQGPEHRVSVTMEVSDLAATLAKVEEAGGTVKTRQMAIPGIGYMANFIDTEGNNMGLIQRDSSAQ